ncbi:MAG: DUF2306 domain-containing protein [Alphaproteobacteria bacterium]|nr:DUF2306 domain-containing protein [Alphaproteobacteria bacterium]MCB9791131.1 DUF2306 domain-containing protein [Alphaproteobacteria bacterium]
MPDASAIVAPPAGGLAARAQRLASRLLGATVWLSAGLFGLYILTFYALAIAQGELARWNSLLPELYTPDQPGATAGIGLHFLMGGVILVLGSVQLLQGVRDRAPRVHRWIGRVYVAACALTAAGGLAFIALQGTIGGWVMDLGFGLYGVLMGICAVETFRHARARRLERHRAWALRLYALAIGSWLYRMDYGFWVLLTDAWGHGEGFSGPFDKLMAFAFYLPNLAVVELVLRMEGRRVSAGPRWAAAGAFLLATGFVALGTYFFTTRYWGPAILSLGRAPLG